MLYIYQGVAVKLKCHRRCKVGVPLLVLRGSAAEQELEKENERLRKAVSDLTLEKLILKEAASGNF